MKIKKQSEEVVYLRKTTEHIFEVNGKRVRVLEYRSDNPMEWDNPEISDQDLKALTEEESETLGDYIDESLRLKVGEEWDTEKII